MKDKYKISGKVKKFKCPKCGEMIEPGEAIWEDGFLEINDLGEVVGCVHCQKGEEI